MLRCRTQFTKFQQRYAIECYYTWEEGGDVKLHYLALQGVTLLYIHYVALRCLALRYGTLINSATLSYVQWR